MAAAALLVAPSISSATIMIWDIATSETTIQLNIPNQSVQGNNITVVSQGGGTWTGPGRTTSASGTITTNRVGGTLEFLSGQHNAFANNSGTFRPNPAAFNPASTNASNPDGQYTNNSGAPAAFGARINGPLNVNLGYVAFRDVELDIASPALSVGGGTFDSTQIDLGVLDALFAFDGLSVIFVGQAIPDVAPTSSGPLLGANTLGGGTMTSPDPIGDPLLRRLQIPFFVDVILTLGEGDEAEDLIASVQGNIVAYGYVPEPTTLVLVAAGLAGLATAGRRRSA